jgi:hypothetical protein
MRGLLIGLPPQPKHAMGELAQTRQHCFGEQRDAGEGIGVVEKAALAKH